MSNVRVSTACKWWVTLRVWLASFARKLFLLLPACFSSSALTLNTDMSVQSAQCSSLPTKSTHLSVTWKQTIYISVLHKRSFYFVFIHAYNVAPGSVTTLDWNISTAIGWIGRMVGTGIHCLQTNNCKDFSPVSFTQVALGEQTLTATRWFSVRQSRSQQDEVH